MTDNNTRAVPSPVVDVEKEITSILTAVYPDMREAVRKDLERIFTNYRPSPLNVESLKRELSEWMERELWIFGASNYVSPIIDHLAATGRLAKITDGWQPIETAPKDGSWISNCYLGKIRWEKGLNMGEGAWTSTPYTKYGTHEIVQPTAWMPLPAAPKPTGDV